VGIIREAGQGTFEELHVGVTRNLVAAAQAAGAERFLYLSALGVRADAPSAYGRTKWRAEEVVRASGLAWLILRPSIVFARDGEFYRLLRSLTAFPLVPVIGPGTARLAPVLAEDLAQVEVEGLSRPLVWNRAHAVAGPIAYAFQDLLLRVALGLDRRIVRVHVPVALVAPVVELVSHLGPLARLAPVTPGELVMLREDSVADPAPIEREFGVRLRPVDSVFDAQVAA